MRQTPHTRRRAGGPARAAAALLVAWLGVVSPALAQAADTASEASESDVDDIEIYGEVPLNGLRFIGTHNSYHQRPRLFGIPFLPISFSKKHRYAHPPLTEQLDGVEGSAGAVRQLEIDLHMRRFDDQVRVFHLPWIDNQSSCKTLQACLGEVMRWSDSIGGAHAPILVWLEPKDETPLDRWLSLGWYERVDLMRVEEVILEVVPRERIFAPDDLRRDEATLPEAIAHHGWPGLAELQGKLIFALLDEPEHRTSYVATSEAENLEGRLMFVRSSTPTEPWAALFKENNAVPTLEDMQAFGREALEDPELAALAVYPEPPEAESAFVAWWKNLWQPTEAEGDASPDSTPPSEAESDAQANRPKPHTEPTLERGVEPDDASTTEQGKDLHSASKTPTREVDWRLRRELRSVAVDTRDEARARHLEEVSELEERLRAEHAPESDELAIVLENARRSRAYRNLLRERLRGFIGEHRRATILALVRDGFLVTTTADEPHRNADQNRRRATSSLLSGAQFVSTDSLTPDRRDGYALEVPGAPIRCNVLVDPDGCAAAVQRRH